MWDIIIVSVILLIIMYIIMQEIPLIKLKEKYEEAREKYEEAKETYEEAKEKFNGDNILPDLPL